MDDDCIELNPATSRIQDVARNDERVLRSITSIFAASSVKIELDGAATYVGPGITSYSFDVKSSSSAFSEKGKRRAEILDALRRYFDVSGIRFDYGWLEVPAKNPKPPSLRELLGSEEWKKASADPRYIPLLLGLSSRGETITAQLGATGQGLYYPHMLIGGASGSGKSELLSAILAALHTCRTPDQLRIALLHPHPGYFGFANSLLMDRMVKNSDNRREVLEFMEGMRELIRQRRSSMDEETLYRKQPNILFVIDNFDSYRICDSRKEEFKELVASCCSLGRGGHVHLLIACSQTNHKTIDHNNIAGGLSFWNFRDESRFAIRTPAASELLHCGDALYQIDNRDQWIRVQTPVTTQEDEKESVQICQNRLGYLQGDENAALGLAGAYLQGKLLPKDFTQAKIIYTRMVAGGSEIAAHCLEQLKTFDNSGPSPADNLPHREARAQCGSCKKPFEFKIYDRIDVTGNQELKDWVVSRRLFRHTCEHCYGVGVLPYSFTYVDNDKSLFVKVFTSREEALVGEDSQSGVDNGGWDEAWRMEGAHNVRVSVAGLDELDEMIRIVDAGLDPYVVMLCKKSLFADSRFVEKQGDSLRFAAVHNWKDESPENLVPMECYLACQRDLVAHDYEPLRMGELVDRQTVDGLIERCASRGVDPSPEFIERKNATEAGGASAWFDLGVSYYNGDGVRQNHFKAFRCFRAGAEAGDADSQHALATCYVHGLGVNASGLRAEAWYDAAAKQGNADSMYGMGLIAHFGTSVKSVNYAEARDWYEKAIAAGHARAHFSLGNLYEDGLGVERDLRKARELYGKAAELGVEDAVQARERTDAVIARDSTVEEDAVPKGIFASALEEIMDEPSEDEDIIELHPVGKGEEATSDAGFQFEEQPKESSPSERQSGAGLKIGKVAQKVFPVLFAEGRITDADVSWLMSDAAIKFLKTSGNQVLRETTDPDVDSRDAKGLRRFYPKFTLPFGGKQYILTSQWFKNGLDNLLSWLDERGISRERVCELCGVDQDCALGEIIDAASELPEGIEVIKESPKPIAGHETVASSGDLKIGKVAQKVIPILFAEGRVEQDDVDWLLSDAAAKHFKTAGYKVIKATTDPLADARDDQGLNRYYSKFTLDFGGVCYLLTSQWYKNGLSNLLAWLEKHGIGEERVREICGCLQKADPANETGVVFDSEPQIVEDEVKVSQRDKRHVPGAHPLTEKDLEDVLPHGILIDGVRIRPASTWADCYLSICEKVQSLDQTKFDGLPDNPMFRRFFIREAAGKKIQDCYLDRFGTASNIRVKQVGSKPYFYMPTYVVQNLLRYFEIDPSRVCIASAEYRDADVEPSVDVAPVVADAVAVQDDIPVVPEPIEEQAIEAAVENASQPANVPEPISGEVPDGDSEQGEDTAEPASEPIVTAQPTGDDGAPDEEASDSTAAAQPVAQPQAAVRSAVVIYGSLTGTTEGVAQKLAERLAVEAINVANATADAFAANMLILGTSTCCGEIQDDWKNAGLAMLDGLDLHGKKVAVFGTGDAVGFDSTFGAGMAVLARKTLERGATLVGTVPASECGEKPTSAILCDGESASTWGLLLDLENSPDEADERITSWVGKIMS